MVKKHLKRLSAPRSWHFNRKKGKFIARPLPSGHPIERGVPLVLMMRQLGYCTTTREAKEIIRRESVLVDSERCTSHRRHIGLMDNVKFGESGNAYTVMLDRNNKIAYVKAAE